MGLRMGVGGMRWSVVARGVGVEEAGCVGGGVEFVEIEVGRGAGGFVVAVVVELGCDWRVPCIVPDRGGYL